MKKFIKKINGKHFSGDISELYESPVSKKD